MRPTERGSEGGSPVPAALFVGYLVVTGSVAMGLGGLVGEVTGGRITGAPRFAPPIAMAVGFSVAGGWIAFPVLAGVIRIVSFLSPSDR